MNQKLLYIGQRTANAARMVRKGEFGKIVHVIVAEIRHRFRKVPDSAYVDLTRRIPPSSRPTQTRLAPPPELKADARQVAEEIQKLMAGIEIEEANDT